MATGLECYDALKTATADLPIGSDYVLNQIERFDLFKLTASDLISRGFDEFIAECVSADLLNQELDELSKTMGINLSHASDAPLLIVSES